MNRHTIIRFISLVVASFFALNSWGQISYGGKPLPFSSHQYMRNSGDGFFVQMPSFDAIGAKLRAEEEVKQTRSLTFAHKFYVHLRPDNSGITFTENGMRVWRVGISSTDAYSINLLFTKYNLPEGAKLFIYSPDQKEVLGAFTHQNNTDLNLLPVQPIGGDALVVEYQEPIVGDSFRGSIEIGEVNHDYMGLFRATEPRDPRDDCHIDFVCFPEDQEAGSAVVVLIINGNSYCTGSLINNTAQDGTPYLITATHCLNEDYDASFLRNRRYDSVAGKIIAFFNYNSPACGSNIRGNTQMSMASADSVFISEKHDVSLLKLKQTPPSEYQVSYLGWNADSSPQGDFHGINHPNGGVKKVAVSTGKVSVTSFGVVNGYTIEPFAHWNITWDADATEGGSSGSPLLDRNKLLIGTLTGGKSFCSKPYGPDQYASFHKLWQTTGSIDNKSSIRTYLDPTNSGVTQLSGYNPNKSNICTRSHNFDTSESLTQTIDTLSVGLFATNNEYGYTEYAEEFFSKDAVQLTGAFIASAPVRKGNDIKVKVRVYTGEKGPEQLVHEQDAVFGFQYLTSNGFATANRNLNVNSENFVRFEKPISVKGRFFIAYTESNGISSGFSALNTEPRDMGTPLLSTAWMKNAMGWNRSSEMIERPMNTSLAITAYSKGSAVLKAESFVSEETLNAYYSKESKRIIIESNSELQDWVVFNVAGQRILSGKTDKSINSTSIAIPSYAKGVYVVKARTQHNTQIVKKVLVY